MELILKYYGKSGGTPSNIIELIIKSGNTVIEEDITDKNSAIDPNLIMQLRDIADELEEQNTLLNDASNQ